MSAALARQYANTRAPPRLAFSERMRDAGIACLGAGFIIAACCLIQYQEYLRPGFDKWVLAFPALGMVGMITPSRAPRSRR